MVEEFGQYPFVILYKDALGSIKYINLFFDSEEIARRFAIQQKLIEFITVSSQEFFIFKESIREGINQELDYYHTRVPRPVQRNITEIIESPDEPGSCEYHAPPPMPRFTTGIAKHPFLFKPIFVGRRRSIDDDSDDDETIINTTDGR